MGRYSEVLIVLIIVGVCAGVVLTIVLPSVLVPRNHKGSSINSDENNTRTTDPGFNAVSCSAIKDKKNKYASGLYTIYSKYGSAYTVYCDMESVGGGWTLVASIHENRWEGGHCTVGDRWSSENGPYSRYKDSNWENTNTFGRPEYATTDDFKNVAYFEMNAKRLMVIQVPNDTPMDSYIYSATYQYYTENQFLTTYGGNLRELFKSFPIIDGKHTHDVDNGPSEEIVFIKGDQTTAHDQYSGTAQQETESGFIQFRAVTHEQAATGFCPYGKMRPGMGNAELACFGISSISGSSCGDFSYLSSSFYYSTFLIFYR